MVWYDFIPAFLVWASYTAEAYGYFGVFFISILSSCSIIWPVFPAPLLIFALGAILNPILLGLVAGAGSAIGELTGYYLGRGVHKLKKEKHKKWLERTEKCFQKHGAFFIIILFAASPLPDDVAGVLCGGLKYDVKKFFLACFIGKTIMYTAIAVAGFYGMNWVLSYFKLGN